MKTSIARSDSGAQRQIDRVAHERRSGEYRGRGARRRTSAASTTPRRSRHPSRAARRWRRRSAIGAVPNALLSTTRTRLPPMLVCTTCRSVWLLTVAGGTNPRPPPGACRRPPRSRRRRGRRGSRRCRGRSLVPGLVPPGRRSAGAPAPRGRQRTRDESRGPGRHPLVALRLRHRGGGEDEREQGGEQTRERGVKRWRETAHVEGSVEGFLPGMQLSAERIESQPPGLVNAAAT